MKRFVVCFLGTLLIILALGCTSQQVVIPQQVTITPTVTVLPTITATPTPHPLAITVENASSLKLQKVIGAGRVNDVAWSPNGDVIAVAQDFDISFYDHTENNIYQLKEMEFKARHWEIFLSKMLIRATKKIA